MAKQKNATVRSFVEIPSTITGPKSRKLLITEVAKAPVYSADPKKRLLRCIEFWIESKSLANVWIGPIVTIGEECMENTER